jgi:acetyltransferase-like isoleucine patch superfamily enzyme
MSLISGIRRTLDIVRRTLILESPVARLRRLGALIGTDVFIGPEVFVDEPFAPLLTIGDGAVISARTVIMLHDSAFNNVLGSPVKVAPVVIHANAYVGANSTILCGVTIGSRTIVGAGSVVTRDIPDDTVAFGCPATVWGTVGECGRRFTERAKEPQRCAYWQTPSWRERNHLFTPEEVHAQRSAVISRLMGSGNPSRK